MIGQGGSDPHVLVHRANRLTPRQFGRSSKGTEMEEIAARRSYRRYEMTDTLDPRAWTKADKSGLTLAYSVAAAIEKATPCDGIEPLDHPHSALTRTVLLLLIVVPLAYAAGSWWGM
jgi:hypothetical protein